MRSGQVGKATAFGAVITGSSPVPAISLQIFTDLASTLMVLGRARFICLRAQLRFDSWPLAFKAITYFTNVDERKV